MLYCKNCRHWKQSDFTFRGVSWNPSGKCNFLNTKYEGWGIHSNQLACNNFKKKGLWQLLLKGKQWQRKI